MCKGADAGKHFGVGLAEGSNCKTGDGIASKSSMVCMEGICLFWKGFMGKGQGNMFCGY